MNNKDLSTSHSNSLSQAVRQRMEIVVPVLAVPFLFMILSSSGRQAGPEIKIVIYIIAILYAGLVIIRPMSLPSREIQPFRVKDLLRTAAWVIPSVILLMAISSLVRALPAETGSTSSNLFKGLGYFLAISVFSTLGIVASRRIPVDLFPLVHKFDPFRAAYILVSCLYLAMMIQIAGSLAGSLGDVLAKMFDQPVYQAKSAASLFDTGNPFRLLVSLLIGAGLFEELLFRVGLLNLLWVATRRYWAALILSSIIFALYHITFSSISSTLQQFPIATVISSIGSGIANGLIYRYRGFGTVVAAHGIGDWAIIMLLNGL